MRHWMKTDGKIARNQEFISKMNSSHQSIKEMKIITNNF